MANIYEFLASVSDDVRHKVIEEGWFGRQVTGRITPNDLPAMNDSPQITPPQPSDRANDLTPEP